MTSQEKSERIDELEARLKSNNVENSQLRHSHNNLRFVLNRDRDLAEMELDRARIQVKDAQYRLTIANKRLEELI